jgi:hypothetical protein
VAACEEGEEYDMQQCRHYDFSAAMLIACPFVGWKEPMLATYLQVEYYLHR